MAMPSEEFKPVKYVFILYVSGMNPRSLRAINNMRRLCEEHLQGRYELKIIDLTKNDEAGRLSKISVVPTLEKQLPIPVRRMIGDLSNVYKVIVNMEIV